MSILNIWYWEGFRACACFCSVAVITCALRGQDPQFDPWVWRLRPHGHPDSWQPLCLLYFTSFYFHNNGEKIFLLNQKNISDWNKLNIVTYIARQCSFCCFKRKIQMDLCGRIKWMNFMSILNIWYWEACQGFRARACFCSVAVITCVLRGQDPQFDPWVWCLRPYGHRDSWQPLFLLYFTSFYFLNNGEKIFLLNQKNISDWNKLNIVTYIERQCSFCCFKRRIQMDLSERIKWMNFLSILNVWYWEACKGFRACACFCSVAASHALYAARSTVRSLSLAP
jgi:hypothetical protein